MPVTPLNIAIRQTALRYIQDAFHNSGRPLPGHLKQAFEDAIAIALLHDHSDAEELAVSLVTKAGFSCRWEEVTDNGSAGHLVIE